MTNYKVKCEKVVEFKIEADTKGKAESIAREIIRDVDNTDWSINAYKELDTQYNGEYSYSD